MKSIVIIPARGGSKGIPRKNLRPIAGKPMIYHSINACLKARGVSDVVVTTDDDEIALFAERFGAKVIMREPGLANDTVTLDPVIIDAAQKYSHLTQSNVGIIITVQPTSPLVTSQDIENCLKLFNELPETETVLSVVDDRHLCWTIEGGEAVPAYKARLNRQQLKPNFRETGAIIACRKQVLEAGTRIGSKVSLLEMPQERSFDIDNISDLHLCESILNTKRIVFVVKGYPEVGLGHAFRCVMLANELVRHKLIFVCEEESSLASQYIASHNYDVVMAENGKLIETVISLSPDLVINDLLDTDADYVKALKANVKGVINFEDLGTGIEHADLVVNALYSSDSLLDHVKTGPKYFCLRDEFLFAPRNRVAGEVETILITFGGVDEGNLTYRVANLLSAWVVKQQIKLIVVTGPGYKHCDSLNKLSKVIPESLLEIVNSTSRISDYMCLADVAVTSGGRTVFELAALEVPMVVICQNERELTHTFASHANGIRNLGYRGDIDDSYIFENITSICGENSVRDAMKLKLKSLSLTQGKKRVCTLIENLLYEV